MENNKQVIDNAQQEKELTYEEAFQKLSSFIIKSKKEEKEQNKQTKEANA